MEREMKAKILFLVMLLVFALRVPLSEAQQETSKAGSTLIYAIGTDALTLDPQFVTDIPTARAMMQIHETLVKYDTDMNLIPCLAESWAVSEDFLTWTFKLRKGVKFHDGTAFNARAVKYTFDRIRDPAIGSPRKSAINMVREVKILGEYTVSFTTDKPFAPFLNQLTAYNLAIMSPAAGEKWGKRYGENPSGTGPFKLDSWIPGEKIVLARNGGYWDKKAYAEKLVFRVVPEDSDRVMLLLKGEVDLISPVPAAFLDKLSHSKEIKIIREKGFRTIYIGLNNRIKPFDDPRVRKAVSHAIHIKEIFNRILKGFGTLGGGLESPAIPGALKGLGPYPYDLPQAKRLLADAGYPNGFKTTFYVPIGRYFMGREVAEAIKAQLKEVGIHVSIETLDWATLIALLEKGTDVPVFLMGKGSPTGDLDLTLNLNVKTGGKMNYFQYSNHKVDSLIAEQEAAADPGRRFKILHEIQKIVYEDCPAIVLFYEDQIFARRTSIHGVEVYPNEFVGLSRALKM
jgi:peptide/nickel transport system substrate-binding protein